GDHFRYTVRCSGVAYHHQTNEHAQSTECGDDQGSHGRTSGKDSVCLIANHQEGQNRGDLPKDKEHHEIIGDHQAKHGTGKCHELRTKRAQPWFIREEIAGTIHQDSCTDTQNNEAQEGTQSIESEGKLYSKLWNPLPGLHQRRVVAICSSAGRKELLRCKDLGYLGSYPNNTGCWYRGEDEEALTSPFVNNQGGDESNQK